MDSEPSDIDQSPSSAAAPSRRSVLREAAAKGLLSAGSSVLKALVVIAYYLLFAESIMTIWLWAFAAPVAHLCALPSKSRFALALRRNALHIGIWAYAVGVGFRFSEAAGWAMAALPLASFIAGAVRFRYVDQVDWRVAGRDARHWMFMIATGIELLIWYPLLAIELAHPHSTGVFLSSPAFRLC